MELPFKSNGENERKLIEKFAKIVVDYGMEDPVIMALETFKPMSFVGSQLILLYFAPITEIVGVPGYELSELFSKRENLDLIREKIEELKKVKRTKLKIKGESSKEQKTYLLKPVLRYWPFKKNFRRLIERIKRELLNKLS